MKKSLFFAAAASALMLTACSSESDVVQNTTQQTQTTVQQQAVGFDTYLSGTTAPTRSGATGVMTTVNLKKAAAGFGVTAFYSDGDNYSTSLKPNFMYNEKVTWDGGWTYSPLKYWPNETTKDSQSPEASSTHTDKLSFFAYAPYVNGSLLAPGITNISANNVAGDPTVSWTYSQSPDTNVDLLWGVAPAGFSYTNVSGSTTSVPVGMPLLNLVKPDKDQKVKFLFQHALSRIGLSVVSAIDQIAAGDDGGKYNTDETRVLIEEVKIWGNFGQSGVLSLNNTDANVANWTSAVRTATNEETPSFTINASTGPLAPDLRYVQTQIDAVTGTTEPEVAGDPSKFANINTGVLPSEQTLLAGAIDASKAVTGTPTFTFGKTYYIADGSNCVKATAKTANTAKVYSKDAFGNYTRIYNAPGEEAAGFEVDGTETNLVMLTGEGSASTEVITTAADYWTWNSTTNTFEKHNGTLDAGTEHYTLSEASTFDATYAGETTYYSAPLPRYFMVVPSALPYVKNSTETEINVKITYHVVTKDIKLAGNVSNISNAITKQTKIQLENGKSYNLKLILGMTSVKLDATVADWQVADDTEIWLPQNNE